MYPTSSVPNDRSPECHSHGKIDIYLGKIDIYLGKIYIYLGKNYIYIGKIYICKR